MSIGERLIKLVRANVRPPVKSSVKPSISLRLGAALTIGGLAGLMVLVSTGGTMAAPSLEKRIDILEKQLRAVQRKVFTPGSMFEDQQGAPQSPAAAPVASQGRAVVANLEARVAQMETQLRQLTGQVEETNHRLNKLIQRLDLLSDDYEFRLSELEKGKGQGAASGSAAGTGGAASSPNLAAVPSGGTQPLLPGGTVREQYDYAYGLVTRGDYIRAEAALQEFLRLYPQDELAGNAKYWLGQTYYARGMFTEATRTFLEGYDQYPKSQKAPAFLLKIGMSLYALGEKKDACEAYRELEMRFPDSVENKNRRPAEARKAGCQ
ncbi:tol-pal system protein YbgF [Luteithermobacter gelatinilyticus]|uniref:tol-pal system protein YbgF n=1 Tax=Luteithermobacter gelatinilyticus TaxID=2582913 RepID=UPI00110756A6|nr:tol-pal system protein YbgF [Luteithermobacter gelatinilyticus]